MALSNENAAKTQCSTATGLAWEWRASEPATLLNFLLARWPDASRDGVRRILAQGGCEVDGVARTGGWRLKAGQIVCVAAGTAVAGMPAEDLGLAVIYEDDVLIAIDKPAGMLSHPTARQRQGTVVNGLRWLLGGVRPHILHRLDRETSGVLLAAKVLERGSAAARLFETRQVEKLYLAVVDGTANWEERIVSAPIGRIPDGKPPWQTLVEGGQAAETRLRVLGRSDGATLIEARPITGRTNQIRIHCASIGLPIAGDVAYGAAAAERLLLHAWRLAIPRPNGINLSIESELPKQFSLKF